MTLANKQPEYLYSATFHPHVLNRRPDDESLDLKSQTHGLKTAKTTLDVAPEGALVPSTAPPTALGR